MNKVGTPHDIVQITKY